MNHNLADLCFDERDLDAAIEEANVPSDVSIEGRRLLAAHAMVALSMSMAIGDEQQYLVALLEIGDLPDDEAELDFFNQFGRVMVEELKAQFDDMSPNHDLSPNLAVFIRRANELLQIPLLM